MSEPEGPVEVTCVLAVADTPNANGDIFPAHALEDVVRRSVGRSLMVYNGEAEPGVFTKRLLALMCRFQFGMGTSDATRCKFLFTEPLPGEDRGRITTISAKDSNGNVFQPDCHEVVPPAGELVSGL